MRTAPELLDDYAARGSEEAFAQLVSLHVDLVYSTALRRTAFDRHLAQDVTQQVFTDLAQKAGSLPKNIMLPGWLHQHTCYRASQAVRTEQRRRVREEKAAAMQTSEDDGHSAWKELVPVLDDALNQLHTADRDALILRFFERRDLGAIGQALGVGEDAAQKRVSRAVDRLRKILIKRGVSTQAATLTSAVALHTVAPAPSGLAAAVAGTALAKSATASITAFSTAKILAMSKIKIAAAAAVAAILVATPLALNYASNRGRHASVGAAVGPLDGPISTFNTFHYIGTSWRADLTIRAGDIRLATMDNRPDGPRASSVLIWDPSPGWFAYAKTNTPLTEILFWVFDGKTKAWKIRGTPLGASIASINGRDEDIPAPVLKRLPNSFK